MIVFLKKLQQLNSQSSVFNKIQEVKNRIAINIDAHEIIEQFSGYFQLKRSGLGKLSKKIRQYLSYG